jgi:phosphoserine aminotransferase
MNERRFNFSSGPATLPDRVLRAAQAAIWDLDGSGIGILEHSHRGPEFAAVIARAETLIRQLAQVSDDHAVLFVTGTASAHFHMVPMNFLSAGHTADYCHTGVWSGKAIAEARRQGAVHLACSSEADQFTQIPSQWQWSPAPAYVHFTSNNTIYGTQWSAPPTPPAGVPLVCDASSDLFSRPIDVGRYDLIYAGAQKNLGPSGITLVIARRSFIASGRRDLPPLLRYQNYADEHSLYNTPNTFGIYVLAEVLQWIADRGGLAAMHAHNLAKARLLYDFLDRSRVFSGHATPDSRSLMNVTFRAATPAIEDALLTDVEAHGMSGLRGHRSVGGLRASIYNAFPLRGVERLVERLEHFERLHASSGA